MKRKKIAAFTLLEVILALAIMVMSLFYLANSFTNSIDTVRSSRDEIRATFVAESILSEIAAGVRPPESIADAEYDAQNETNSGEAQWLYSVEVQPQSMDGLLGVQVTVIPKSSETTRAGQVKLTRWLIDPVFMANVQSQLAANAANAASSNSTTSGSSSPTTSGTGNNNSSNNSGNSSNATGT